MGNGSSAPEFHIETVEHEPAEWGDLSPWISDGGVVDYEGLESEDGVAALSQCVNKVRLTKAEALSTTKQKLAFYSNAYNIMTLYGVLKERSRSPEWSASGLWSKYKFFFRRKHTVAGEVMTLHHLEGKMLRPLGDPRVHAYINCASFSCPKLCSTFLTEDNVDEVLDERSRHFVRGHGVQGWPAVGAVPDEVVEVGVSTIFKWYTSDWDACGGVIAWLNAFRDPDTAGALPDNAKLTYLPYDWSLNDH